MAKASLCSQVKKQEYLLTSHKRLSQKSSLANTPDVATLLNEESIMYQANSVHRENDSLCQLSKFDTVPRLSNHKSSLEEAAPRGSLQENSVIHGKNFLAEYENRNAAAAFNSTAIIGKPILPSMTSHVPKRSSIRPKAHERTLTPVV